MVTKKLAAEELGSVPPVLFKNLQREIEARAGRKPPPEQMLDFQFFVSSTRPRIRVSTSRLRGQRASRVAVQVRGLLIGQHVFPPAVKTRRLPARRKLIEVPAGAEISRAYVPEHLAVRPLPSKLERALQVPPRIDALGKLRKGVNAATTVFAPDNRYVFNDTAYPWSATGRVDTALGWASGVAVGPRHILTCSHVIQWLPNNTAGWIRFTPSYFNGSAPFGIGWGTWIYWDAVRVDPPWITWAEGQHDYVCVVLNTNIGNLTGWMGSRAYSDSWDGGAYWSHIGYPGDLSSGERPSFQGGIALDGTADPDQHQNIVHQGDVWPGQSGGPFFGWWAGEVGPRAVSVQSWQNNTQNGASGGSHLVDMIIRARNDHP